MSIHSSTQWIRKQKLNPGLYGVEIETETMERYPLEVNGRNADGYNFPAPYQLEYWKIVEDHSLRNVGYEYVLTKPLDMDDLARALFEFQEKTNGMELKFLEDRHSCSVHVHINFQNETFKTLGTFITLFTLFEEVLIEYCGEGRRSNFFCLSNKYSSGMTRLYEGFFQRIFEGDKLALTTLDEEVSKYSSLNLVPLYKQGSVEIRTMRGVTDVAVIAKWVGMLNTLLKLARQATPLDVISCWRQEGTLYFQDIFEEYIDDLYTERTMDQIEGNLWAAASIACSVWDWDQIDAGMEAKMAEFKAKQDEYDAKYGMKPPPAVPDVDLPEPEPYYDEPVLDDDDDNEILEDGDF